MNRNRLIRLVASILIGVAAAAAIAYYQTKMPQDVSVSSGNGYIGKPFGGDFADLMDQDGRVQGRDAFHDKYQLVFFGFTHCPAICPNELQKIGYVLKNLPADKRAKLAPILITVDPTRDTPDILKSYLSVFEPGITALTGRQERINQVLSDWKIYAAKVPTEGGDYTMDHSAFLYLRDPQGTLIGLFAYEDAPDAILGAVKAKIGG